MNIKITAVLDAEISNDELAEALFVAARRLMGIEDIDDAGSDWYTDDYGNTYIAHRGWKVSSNPQLAAMIDSYYALKGYSYERFKFAGPKPSGRQAAD